MTGTVTKFPSFNWMRGVCADHRISIIHRLVLIRILIHRQKDGQCDPGYNTVARELGVHRTTVIRAVDVAVRFGWLAPPMRGRRENANFVFLFPAAADQEVPQLGDILADQEVAQLGDFLEVAENSALASQALENTGGLRSRSGFCKPLEIQANSAPNGHRSKNGHSEEGGGPLKGPSHPLEREGAVLPAPAALAGSGRGGAGADAPPAAAEPTPGTLPLTGEILEPERKNPGEVKERKNTIEALSALWDRGHVGDRAAAEQQRVRVAWRQAITAAEPAAILAGARKWITAADAPKFLPKLADWLDACGWQEPPPRKRRRPPTGASPPRRRSNGSANSVVEAAEAARRIGRES